MKETKGDYNRMGLAKASIEKSEANIKFSSDETNFRNELISIYQKNLSEIKIIITINPILIDRVFYLYNYLFTL
jgi:enoyl-[acyl-carrier-protein] reductase (NADH)